MKNKKFSTRITICKEIYDITENGGWRETTTRVKSVWAHVVHTFIKGHVPYLKFYIYGGEMLPDKFCILYNKRLWKISSGPVLLPDQSRLIFSCIPMSDYGVVGNE